jgi:hypothetical protein
MFHTINDQQQPPTCPHCHVVMIWDFSHGWHCIELDCRQKNFQLMMRRLANGRAGLGRSIERGEDYALGDWETDDE